MGDRLPEIHDKFPASLGLLCRGLYPARACFHWLGKASSTAFTTLAKRHRSGRDGHNLCGLVIPNSAMGDSFARPRIASTFKRSLGADAFRHLLRGRCLTVCALPKGCSSIARDCRMVSADDLQKIFFHCLTNAVTAEVDFGAGNFSGFAY